MALAKELAESRFLLHNLISKDFALKYRRSVLGILWSLLNPLLMMVVLTAVFSTIFRFDIAYFPLYLILGQLLFDLMSKGSSDAMVSISGAADLLKKVRIEKIVFPLEKVLFALINSGLSLVCAIGVTVFLGCQINWTILLSVYPILCTVVFTLGLGLLLSSLAVFFQDVIHLWGVLLTVWNYLSAIFYPVSILEPWMMSLIQCNPLYHFITYLRDVWMNGVVPSMSEAAVCAAFALGMLAIGYAVFRATQRKFILYI